MLYKEMITADLGSNDIQTGRNNLKLKKLIAALLLMTSASGSLIPQSLTQEPKSVLITPSESPRDCISNNKKIINKETKDMNYEDIELLIKELDNDFTTLNNFLHFNNINSRDIDLNNDCIRDYIGSLQNKLNSLKNSLSNFDINNKFLQKSADLELSQLRVALNDLSSNVAYGQKNLFIKNFLPRTKEYYDIVVKSKLENKKTDLQASEIATLGIIIVLIISSYIWFSKI
jgi:hypothetical protein